MNSRPYTCLFSPACLQICFLLERLLFSRAGSKRNQQCKHKGHRSERVSSTLQPVWNREQVPFKEAPSGTSPYSTLHGTNRKLRFGVLNLGGIKREGLVNFTWHMNMYKVRKYKLHQNQLAIDPGLPRCLVIRVHVY